MIESSKPQPRNSWSGETAQGLLTWGDKEPQHLIRRIKRASPNPGGGNQFPRLLLEALLSFKSSLYFLFLANKPFLLSPC
jgi:hypothetical protein